MKSFLYDQYENLILTLRGEKDTGEEFFIGYIKFPSIQLTKMTQPCSSWIAIKRRSNLPKVPTITKIHLLIYYEDFSITKLDDVMFNTNLIDSFLSSNKEKSSSKKANILKNSVDNVVCFNEENILIPSSPFGSILEDSHGTDKNHENQIEIQDNSITFSNKNNGDGTLHTDQIIESNHVNGEDDLFVSEEENPPNNNSVSFEKSNTNDLISFTLIDEYKN